MYCAHMPKNELLQWLLDRDGLNTNSLSAAVKGASTQSQIHRFLHGVAKEPKRSTLAPIAEFFGVPLDAFYYPEVAESVLTSLKAGEPVSKAPSQSDAREIALLADWLNGIQNVSIRKRAIDACLKIALEARDQESRPPTHDKTPVVNRETQRA